MFLDRVPTLSLCLLLAGAAVAAGCKEEPSRLGGSEGPEVTAELLERYARYREAYAGIVADERARVRARRGAEGAGIDRFPQGSDAPQPSAPREGVLELAARALEEAGLTEEEASVCQMLVSVVITSELVIEGKLEALEASLKAVDLTDERRQQLQESLALYREQHQRAEERIEAAKRIHGAGPVKLVEKHRAILAAAEQKIIEAGR